MTINSAAKTFSITGWKIGYVLAPPDLTEALGGYTNSSTFAARLPSRKP